MRFLALAATFILAAAAPASAQTMNAQHFHKRATALQKKGPMALFSRSEISALMKEGKAATERARAQRLAAVKAGTKPRYCPPEGPQSLDSREFMKRLAAIPEAERSRIDMTEAMTRILAAKYPCSA